MVLFTLGDFIKSNIDVIVVILAFILSGYLFDKRHEKTYLRCKKKCGSAECREWLCKYFHEPRKEYVLVSQGVEIFRTYIEDEAVEYAEEANEEWREYVARCIEDDEPYADNEIFVFVESGNGEVEELKLGNYRNAD